MLVLFDTKMTLSSFNTMPEENQIHNPYDFQLEDIEGLQGLRGPIGTRGPIDTSGDCINLTDYMDSDYNINFDVLCMVYPFIDISLLKCSIDLHENNILIGNCSEVVSTIYKNSNL